MSSHRPMEGIRSLDVADHTFVPAASAILSDWGAEVIKIEHITRGDAAVGSGRPVWRCSRARCRRSSSTPTGAS